VLVKLFTSYATCREQFLIPDLGGAELIMSGFRWARTRSGR
jgi:hypothetical protein